MSPLRQRWQTLRDLLLVCLLSLPLTSPLWRVDSVACTHDGHLHYHRIVALKTAWEQGLLFSRWQPDLAFGLGYPFFVYREPLPLYLVLFIHKLGFALPAAGNLFYAACLIGSACFMYLWVRDIFGRTAGFVGAIAYVAAPYQLIDAVIRGNLPESIGLALFPLILWASRRYIKFGTAKSFIIATVAMVSLGLSHNISTFIFGPSLLVYLLAISLSDSDNRGRNFGRAMLLMGLGFGMAIFYMGTAVTEINSVSLYNSVNARNNAFDFNYTNFQELFWPPTTNDPNGINPHLYIRIGWIPAVLALIGALSLLRQKQSEQRLHVWLMALAALGYIAMSLPISDPLWRTLPLIDFIQFPWRFVGRAALPIAMLTAAPFGLINKEKLSSLLPTILAGLAIAFLLLEAIPALYVAYCDETQHPTVQTLFKYEHETGMIGVDPRASYFPRTVKNLPQSSPLEADYLAHTEPKRFDSRQLPAGASVTAATYKPLKAVVEVTSPSAFTAQYLTFDFAGWTAKVDGQTVPITPSDPHGLIQFEVPAGTHEIEVKWGGTLVRNVLSALSIMALAGVVLVSAVSAESSQPITRPPTTSPHLGKTLLIVAIGFAALKFGIVDRTETIFRRASTPTMAVGGQGLETADFTFGGYTLYDEAVPSGGSFDIDLTWIVKQNPATQYQSNIFVVDDNGLIWSEKETYRTRLYETPGKMVFWQPNQWALDSHEVIIETGTPAGDYTLMLNQFVLETLQPLTFSDPSGLIGPDAIIGTITILPADESRDVTPQFSKNEPLPTGQKLVGYNQDRAEARPGDPLLVSLFIDAGETKTADSTLSLLTSSGTEAHSWEVDLQSADYIIRNQLPLRLPANLNDDVYTLSISDVMLGTLTIDAPERNFTQPDSANPLAHQVGDLATLIGATDDDAGIELVWRVETETAVSYRIFVHMLNDTGNIVAQSDGEPASWSRPTTGWVAGEYIVDGHAIAVPDGVTQLNIGLYNPDTGDRLGEPIQLVYPLP